MTKALKAAIAIALVALPGYSQSPVIQSNVGIFRDGFFWILDVDGNRQFNSPPDVTFAYGGITGDVPITGDWTGSGYTRIGIYRPGTAANGWVALFILDSNGDGQFDAGDAVLNLGLGTQTGDVPVVGDWNGDGRTKVGIFRSGNTWLLDYNGDGAFNANDRTYIFGGVSGDIPVVGDWTGTGTSKIGVFRLGYYWVLDANGNGTFDGTGPGLDLAFPFGGAPQGQPADVPVVGDWVGSGVSNVGVFRQGFFWILDSNGNHQFDGNDQTFPFGGITGDKPIVGKWSALTPQYQNDNGSFIDDTYIALLGRTADSASWTTAVTNLNAGSSRDSAVNAILSGSEYLNDQNTFASNNGFGCGWPTDANGKFIIMLYHYALNRCPTGYPSSGEYLYWEKALGAAATKGSVVAQIVYSAEFQTDHASAVNSFLASQSATAPTASAVWFGSSPGGSDSVQVLYQGLYRTDFYDFAGSSDITQATVIVGPSSTYNGSCSVQYSPGAQTLSLLNNSGAVVGSGIIGQPGSGGDLILSGAQCSLDVTASSATAAGATLSLFLSLDFMTAGTYGWYGQSQALSSPNTVLGPVSGSLGTIAATGTSAPATAKAIMPAPPPPAEPLYYVLNDGISVGGPWSYCIGDVDTGLCLPGGEVSAASVHGCSAGLNTTSSSSYPSSVIDAEDNDWDTAFTATYLIAPGWLNLTCSFYFGNLTVQSAVEVFDATPVIRGVQVTTPDPVTGQFYVEIFGTNLGTQYPMHGSVSVCNETTLSCSDYTLTLDGAQYFAWSSLQVNVLLTPTAQASAGDTYDVQITSNGESGQGFAGLSGLSQPLSNKAQFLSPGQDPTVTITGPVGVPVGASDTFSVSVTQPQPSNPVPITLSLSTTTGSGAVQFSNGSTSMTITTTETVVVQGIAPSSTADNIQLLAQVQGRTGVLAQTNFSAVTVQISLQTGQNQTVASDNLALKAWVGAVGTANLGPQIQPKYGVCSVIVQLTGTVTPSNYKGKVVLKRNIVSGAEYLNSTAFEGQNPQLGPDNSFMAYTDNDPQAGKIKPGTVYDLDGAGNGPGVPPLVGTWRYRANFSEYAVLNSVSNSTPVSPPFPYYTRSSCKAPLQFANDFVAAGDNQAGTGTTKTSYNLQ